MLPFIDEKLLTLATKTVEDKLAVKINCYLLCKWSTRLCCARVFYIVCIL